MIHSLPASLLRVPAMEPAIIEEDGEKKQTDNQLVPFVPSNETEISSAPSRGVCVCVCVCVCISV